VSVAAFAGHAMPVPPPSHTPSSPVYVPSPSHTPSSPVIVPMQAQTPMSAVTLAGVGPGPLATATHTPSAPVAVPPSLQGGAELSRPVAPASWMPARDVDPPVELRPSRRPLVIVASAIAVLLLVLLIWRVSSSSSSDSPGAAPLDAAALAVADPVAPDAALAGPVTPDAEVAAVTPPDAAEVAVSIDAARLIAPADAAVVAATSIDAGVPRPTPPQPIKPDPLAEIRRLASANSYADAASRCAALPRVTSEIATVCTLAACKTKDVAKARRWFKTAKREVLGVCRAAGVDPDPPATTTTKTKIKTGDCGSDMLGCQH